MNIFGAQLKKTNLEKIYQDIGVIARTATEACLCGSNKVIKGFSYNGKYAEVLKRKSKITSNFYSNKSKFFLKLYSLEI